MKSEPKTAIYLDFMNNNSATDYDFITFVDMQMIELKADFSGVAELILDRDIP